MKEFRLDIKQLNRGNKQAFKHTFDCLFKSLCLFVNRFTQNLPAAEDITQEIFLALWNHHEEMSSAGHVKSFLYMSARNAALDYLRHEKIRNQYDEQAIRDLETTENFLYYIIEEEVEHILLKTEENLPGQCKKVFILAMQGKENEEIASLLGISINTVKTQKKIAYRKLKHFISELSVICLSIQ